MIPVAFSNETFEISIEDYCKLFKDVDSHLLLDVREPWEVEKVALKNSLAIPLLCLENNLDLLRPEKWIVIYCHHGIRSLRACHLLREKGFDKVVSLKGGIHRWSQILDPQMITY